MNIINYRIRANARQQYLILPDTIGIGLAYQIFDWRLPFVQNFQRL
jgi:hypothetical protein